MVLSRIWKHGKWKIKCVENEFKCGLFFFVFVFFLFLTYRTPICNYFGDSALPQVAVVRLKVSRSDIKYFFKNMGV